MKKIFSIVLFLAIILILVQEASAHHTKSHTKLQTGQSEKLKSD